MKDEEQHLIDEDILTRDLQQRNRFSVAMNPLAKQIMQIKKREFEADRRQKHEPPPHPQYLEQKTQTPLQPNKTSDTNMHEKHRSIPILIHCNTLKYSIF